MCHVGPTWNQATSPKQTEVPNADSQQVCCHGLLGCCSLAALSCCSILHKYAGYYTRTQGLHEVLTHAYLCILTPIQAYLRCGHTYCIVLAAIYVTMSADAFCAAPAVYASKSFKIDDGRQLMMNWVVETSVGCTEQCSKGTPFTNASVSSANFTGTVLCSRDYCVSVTLTVPVRLELK